MWLLFSLKCPISYQSFKNSFKNQSHFCSWNLRHLFAFSFYLMPWKMSSKSSITQFFRCSLVWIRGSWWIWHRGFIGQMSLPGSLWKSSETFHPRLWRLDWDFLLRLEGWVFVMFSFFQSSERLKFLLTGRQNHRAVSSSGKKLDNSCEEFNVWIWEILSVCLAQSRHKDLNQFKKYLYSSGGFIRGLRVYC